ncbi:MAG: hypothetical protein ABI666_10865 [Ferruginibacter sp.]
MLSEEQIKKLVSVNESLQAQMEDLNTVLNEREKELDILKKSIAEATILRSNLDIQLEEIHSIQNRLSEKQQQAKGAEEREIELQQELTEAARLQNQCNDLAKQYAYLHTQFTDIQSQLTEVNKRNLQLQQIAGRIGELESKLENTERERDDLKSRLTVLESQKYLREFNL